MRRCLFNRDPRRQYTAPIPSFSPVRAPWLLYTPRRARTLTPPQLATLRDTAAAPAIGDMQ